MLDLIISGGTAVMPGAVEPADIGVSGSKIAAIGAAESLGSIGAARIVDASNQIVMPGGIDPHIHCSMPIPFPGRNEDLLSAPPEQVSRAALYGGTTTLLDFAQCPPDQPLQRSIELRQREWAGACYCDYGLHLLLYGKLSQGVLDALPEAIARHRVTVVGQIPALFNLEWNHRRYADFDLSSLRAAIYGGQGVPRAFLDRLRAMAPEIGTGLGLTETSGFCTYTAVGATADDLAEGIGFDSPLCPISVRAPMAADGSAGPELAADTSDCWVLMVKSASAVLTPCRLSSSALASW